MDKQPLPNRKLNYRPLVKTGAAITAAAVWAGLSANTSESGPSQKDKARVEACATDIFDYRLGSEEGTAGLTPEGGTLAVFDKTAVARDAVDFCAPEEGVSLDTHQIAEIAKNVVNHSDANHAVLPPQTPSAP